MGVNGPLDLPGRALDDGQANRLVPRPHLLEVEVLDGGQPRYLLLLGLE